MSDLEKSSSDSKKSSPRRLLAKIGSFKKAKSAPPSLNSSPDRRSSLGSIYAPRNTLECFWCKSNLSVDGDKVLAIKCTCNPSVYFCSKLCHRSHWVDPSSGQCKLINFKDLDEKIGWEEDDYVHNIKVVKSTVEFPVKIMDVMNHLYELQAFRLDIDMKDILITVSNLNKTEKYTLSVIPKNKNAFDLYFIDGYEFSFHEYNKFLQAFQPYFRSDIIPNAITIRLKNND